MNKATRVSKCQRQTEYWTLLNAQAHTRSCLIPELGFLSPYIVPHLGAKPLCGRFL